MALPGIQENFASRATKFTVKSAFALSLIFTPMANAEAAPQCDPLFVSPHGVVMDASYSAHRFSKEQKGNVGISITPGVDLGNVSPHTVGTHLVNEVGNDFVHAKCFVQARGGPNGTSIDFKVNGLSQPNPNGGVNISTAMAPKTHSIVRGKATLDKISANEP